MSKPSKFILENGKWIKNKNLNSDSSMHSSIQSQNKTPPPPPRPHQTPADNYSSIPREFHSNNSRNISTISYEAELDLVEYARYKETNNEELNSYKKTIENCLTAASIGGIDLNPLDFTKNFLNLQDLKPYTIYGCILIFDELYEVYQGNIGDIHVKIINPNNDDKLRR